MVDRGVDTIGLYRLIQQLRVEASAQGGRVVSVLGNHEIMNMIGDWRYVHPDDIASFGGHNARQEAFSPEGWIGEDLLSMWNLTAKVQNSVFCHGGIHPFFAVRGVDGINEATLQTLPDYVTSGGNRSYDIYGLFGGHGPTWYRGYALDNEEEVCPILEKALTLLEVRLQINTFA